MSKTVTTRYDVAEHLRTPEEMAAYLEACLESEASFVCVHPRGELCAGLFASIRGRSVFVRLALRRPGGLPWLRWSAAAPRCR
jgi:hypothetical protein